MMNSSYLNHLIVSIIFATIVWVGGMYLWYKYGTGSDRKKERKNTYTASVPEKKTIDNCSDCKEFKYYNDTSLSTYHCNKCHQSVTGCSSNCPYAKKF